MCNASIGIFFCLGDCMAQYDGSIRINTQINTKNAEINLSTLENRIVKTSDKIASLRSKMDSLKDTKIPTQEYKNLENELGKLTNKFDSVAEKVHDFEKLGTDKNFTPFRQARDEAQELYIKIEDIRGAMYDLEESGKAFTLGSETEEFAKLGQQLRYAENDLSVLNQKHEVLGMKLKNVKEGYKKLGNTAKKSLEKINKSTKKTGGLLGTLGSRFKGLALSLLVFNQISKAVRSMSNAIKEGFSNLYNDSNITSFKNQIDSLKASLLTLKNTFAAAFLPLVEIVIPYIQRFVEWLTKAVNLVGQFIAALTGKKTYTKAIKMTADDLKDEAKAAEEAKEATEGYLSPLDEINKYQERKSNETKDKEIDPGTQMFEEVPIDNKIFDFLQKIKDFLKPIIDYAKKLKDIFMQGFWDGLGDWQYRWESIKDSIASIKESLIDIFTDPAVLAAADGWAQSVVYMLGSLVGSLASIGLTIAANLLGGIAKYLEQNKERIKEYLISMFNIWEEVNYMFADLFQSIAYVFEAFASEQGQQLTANIIGIFADAFMGITELASKLFRDIVQIIIKPFVDNKEAFRTALEGFLGVLAEVTGTIKQGIDDTFAKLNEVYDTHFKPFFDSVAQGLSDLVGKFIEFWNGNVQPILDQMAADFDTLWTSHIQPLLNNAAEFLGKIADLLKALWENILQPLIAWIIENILPKILPVIQAIWDMLVNFVAYIADAINGIITILGGIIDFLTGVFTGDWELAFQGLQNIVGGFIDAVMALIEGFATLISDAVNGIFEAIKALLDAFVEAITSIIETFLDWMLENIINKGEEINQRFTDFFSGIKEKWSEGWNSLKEKVSSIIEEIKSTIQSAFDWIGEKVSAIGEKLSSIGSKAKSIFKGSIFGGGSFSTIPYSTSSYMLHSPEIAKLANVEIPGYATGQVIPRTMKQHLAILGDNNRETEVVSPLSTIEQAVENVMAKIGSTSGIGNKELTIRIPVIIDGKQITEIVLNNAMIRQMSTGNNPFMLGTT